VGVQSIGATIEPGDPAGDGFLGATAEVAFGKMDSVAEAHHLAQEVRSVAEALEDTGHLLTTGVCTPLVVDLRNLAGGVRIFDDIDFGLRVRHCLLPGCTFSGRRLAHLKGSKAPNAYLRSCV
jgi:hypothetical protein